MIFFFSFPYWLYFLSTLFLTVYALCGLAKPCVTLRAAVHDSTFVFLLQVADRKVE